MIKWKSIVLVLLLMLTVFILDHPIFGQLRPFQRMLQQQKTEQHQQPLMPGLYIPRPAPLAPERLEMMRSKQKQPRKRIATRPLTPPSQEMKTQYFTQAAKTTLSPSALPDFINAFTFSVSNLYIPGKGGVTHTRGMYLVYEPVGDYFYTNEFYEKLGEYDPGRMDFDTSTCGQGEVEIQFLAKKGVYLLIIDTVDPQDCVAFITLKYTAEGKNNPDYKGYGLNVNGQSVGGGDQGFAYFSFPVCMLQDGVVDVFLLITQAHGGSFRSCEVIPQH